MTAAQVCVCCDVLPRHSARLSQSLVGLCGGNNIYFWKLTIDEGIFANYGFVHCGANWNTGFLIEFGSRTFNAAPCQEAVW